MEKYMRVPKVSLVVLISLLSFASALAAPHSAPSAETTCATGSCKIYLSLMTVSSVPQQVAPADGFVSPSLAPGLIWSPIAESKHQIQVSSDPQFLPGPTMPVSITKTIRQPIPAQVDTTITSNLKGSTLFYWRVGVLSDQGYIYSPVRRFTTPAKSSGTLPAATTILAPKSNARIEGSKVAMQWKAIPGATAYRIRLYDQNGNSVSAGTDELGGTTNTLLVEGIPLGTYHWKVKCMNAFGWGSYSKEFYFTLY
jgi:hypothetical protein